MSYLLECVPNFSEGRDPDFIPAVVRAIESAGAEVLDASSDVDHHRSVVTFLGTPSVVEDAAVAAARIALDRIDLTDHRGVHPRIGALDVLPIVPMLDTPMAVARESAHRVGRRIADLGVPVHFYAEAADPPGRRLAELRRGGVEAYRSGWPEGRRPALDARRADAHPTAGVTCVGARPLLLAWNVVVEGIPLAQARALAAELREVGGGFAGLRALAFRLESRGAVQISMNLEDVENRDPWSVWEEIERRVAADGGRIVETEVIGMIPDPLVLAAAAHRLRLYGTDTSRLLSRRIARHRHRSPDPDVRALAEWVDGLEDPPVSIREAALRLRGRNPPPSVSDESA